MAEKVKVDKADAQRVLYTAYKEAQKPGNHGCTHSDFIDFVLDNTHKTYKYVLVNALLAKATNQAINPLCLQKKSLLPGSYDARTICHDVLVKFEKDELGKALGGLNEPFLNKPARFTDLDKGNAVRAGRDKEILDALCDNLPKFTTSAKAFAGLVYALYKLLQVKAERAALTDFTVDATESTNDIYQLFAFMDDLLEQNFEGEILTLVVAGLFEQFLSDEETSVVEVHPVNESGASSKEISDLDIYRNGNLYVANELKDKEFTDHDIAHAADKVMAVGKMHMNFIFGRHGGCDPRVVRTVRAAYLDKGFVAHYHHVQYRSGRKPFHFRQRHLGPAQALCRWQGKPRVSILPKLQMPPLQMLTFLVQPLIQQTSWMTRSSLRSTAK